MQGCVRPSGYHENALCGDQKANSPPISAIRSTRMNLLTIRDQQSLGMTAIIPGDFGYSCRSDFIGSVAAARRAGIQVAINATVTKTRGIMAKVRGSRGLVS